MIVILVYENDYRRINGDLAIYIYIYESNKQLWQPKIDYHFNKGPNTTYTKNNIVRVNGT